MFPVNASAANSVRSAYTSLTLTYIRVDHYLNQIKALDEAVWRFPGDGAPSQLDEGAVGSFTGPVAAAVNQARDVY